MQISVTDPNFGAILETNSALLVCAITFSQDSRIVQTILPSSQEAVVDNSPVGQMFD